MPEAPPREAPRVHERVDYSAFEDDSPPSPREAAKIEKMTPPDEVFEEIKGMISTMPRADRLALAGCALIVLASFFPWRDTAKDGEILGLMSSGIIATLAAIAAGAAVIARTRRSFPHVNPMLPWLVQLGSVCFAIVWCLMFMRASWDARLVTAHAGNLQQAVSKPAIGVVVALLAGIVGLSGTLMGVRSSAR
jgi:hypothetical protein